MVESSLSSNPWCNNLEPLPTKTIVQEAELEYSQILFNLADILDEWPGVTTSELSPEERHDRFVRAVAGYPEIEIATRPLDWPLHPKSIKALSTSLAIDDLLGINPKSSLRSEILNLDMNERHRIKRSGNQQKHKWRNLTAKCLGLLFSCNSTSESRVSKESLLAVIFSYDNNEGITSGWRESFEEQDKVPTIIENPGEKLEFKKEYRPIKKAIEEGSDLSRFQDCHVDGYSDYVHRLQDIKAYEKYHPYIFPVWSHHVTFQFYRIQTWLRNLVKFDRSEGTPQRVLRGASMVLESVISEIRDLAMEKFGPGSIIIDGGGRLRVLVPDLVAAVTLKEEIETRFEEFLAHPHKTAQRLSRDLKLWWDALDIKTEVKKHPNPKEPGIEGEIKRGYIKDFAEMGLPPRRVVIGETAKAQFTIYDSQSLCQALNRWGKPPEKRTSNKFQESCPWLNEEISKLITKKKWSKVPSWVKRKDGLKEGEVNPNHRLLYLLGHSQRLRDSVLHRPRISEKKFYATDVSRNRKVMSLLKLDGNSVGHIFKIGKEELSLESMRRRSFRFNSHWWQSIFYSIDELDTNGGDIVGVWIVAGDDILIGEYETSIDSNASILDDFMINLAKQIDKRINVELSSAQDEKPRLFTFSAGHAKRDNSSIRSMLTVADICEKSAKFYWKKEIVDNKNKPELIDEAKENKEPQKLVSGYFINNSLNYYCDNNDIVYDNNDGVYDEEESEREHLFKHPWPEKWDNSSLEKSLQAIGEKLPDSKIGFQKLFEKLTRCESDMDSGETYFIVKQ